MNNNIDYVNLWKHEMLHNNYSFRRDYRDRTQQKIVQKVLDFKTGKISKEIETIIRKWIDTKTSEEIRYFVKNTTEFFNWKVTRIHIYITADDNIAAIDSSLANNIAVHTLSARISQKIYLSDVSPWPSAK